MRQHSHSWLTLGLLIGLLIVLALLRLSWRKNSLAEPSKQISEIARKVEALEAREKQAAQTVWAKELLAERCGAIFEQLWDSLNSSTNKWTVLARFACGEIVLPKFEVPLHGPHGIEVFQPAAPGSILGQPEWLSFLRETELQGWRIVQNEFRQVQFDTDDAGRPDKSRFYFSGHLLDWTHGSRAVLEGSLAVQWKAADNDAAPPSVVRIDASGLTLKVRSGDLPFREVLNEQIEPPHASFFIDPLILYDLNGDGRSEIILAAKNLVIERRADGTIQSRPLCHFTMSPIFTGIIADFDGDGVPDFLCARFEGVYLFKGAPGGRFDEPAVRVWSANPHLKYAQALTCGDVDGDGDLDVWLGQYKLPYDRGQMPTPFYDANDGFPSYLLINDGHGGFSDGTAPSGLGQKRRRVYSASFVDLWGSRHLDLLVASDFAGVELFANDGQGRFTDVTKEAFAKPHGFGMAQLSADLNRDGVLDLLVIGMNVPVMDRLRHFGLSRPGFENYIAMGAAMVSGNKLFLGHSSGSFEEGAFGQALARTGWSWGADAFDWDNDGFADVYVANGHERKQSVRDYEVEFWLHDIYVGNSRDDLTNFAYFKAKHARTRGKGMSYGGYEHNRFFLNQGAQSFLEAGFFMGVALEQDSRNVVADDLDGDGRMDLLVTTFEAWPEVKQTVRIYQNEVAERGNWIGFQFREKPGKPSPVGTRVTVYSGGNRMVQDLVTGAGYRSQRANTLHFGLGAAQEVEQVEVRWPDGHLDHLRRLELNRYHLVEQ